MKKAIVIYVFTLVTFICAAQQHASKVDISSQEFTDRIEIYATNSNPIPVSVKLSFNLQGLEEIQQSRKYSILRVDNAPQLVASLIKVPNKGWSYKYSMQVYLGNFYAPGHDSTFVYTLPFEKGDSYYLSQGYGGVFSHQNENAIDFVMPEGTAVMAIRGGIVAEVIEHNNDGCPYRSCMKMSNSILIYHEDGTFARYAHLKLNGAIVEVGDTVLTGAHIGFSGNTGWSSEPHLHFSVFAITEDNTAYSIPTRFQTIKGVEYLAEKQQYKRP